MVKKANARWRMCVNFTDLNNACPKDSYPFPCIDQFLDSASRCRLLTFMDAYSGYNQIRMHPLEEDKMTVWFKECRSNLSKSSE